MKLEMQLTISAPGEWVIKVSKGMLSLRNLEASSATLDVDLDTFVKWSNEVK